MVVAQPVEVIFWHSVSNPVNRKSIEGAVANFNAIHPNIHVKVVLVPGGEIDITKLMTAVAAGTISVIPTLIFFFFAQKYLIEGIKLSGIKG